MTLKSLMPLTLILSLPLSCYASEEVEALNRFKSTQHIVEQLQLKDVGQTTFSVLFWDIYTSKLQTSTGRYPLQDNAQSLLYQIEYLADISSKDLIQRTVEQWQHLGVPEETYQPFVPELAQLWPDIRDGDSLALLVRQQRSAFYFNGNYIGDIANTEFSGLFLDIWLSEKTSQPKLRQELLQGSLDD